MLRKRLITTLTFHDGVLSRTKHFQPDYRYTANFVDAWSIDEVVLLDITRSLQGDRQSFYEVVERFASKAFVPLAVGGRIRSLDEVRKLMSIGADKIVVNTGALERPELISEIATAYGSQCAVVSIDAKKDESGEYRIYKNCGQELVTGLTLAEWVEKCQKMGAGEILITSMDRDGSLDGYDNELNRIVTSAAQIQVIVSGGAGKWQDFVDGFSIGGASAVSTSNIYHFTETSIRSAKKYLHQAGILVRL